MRFDSNLFSRPHYALHLKDPFYHHILMIPDLTVVPSASTRHLIVPEAVAVAAAVAVATEAAATDVEAAVVATTAAAVVVSLRFIPTNDRHPWLMNACGGGRGVTHLLES
jgi:1,6-anhydro-N-acetylmuramate kinase